MAFSQANRNLFKAHVLFLLWRTKNTVKVERRQLDKKQKVERSRFCHYSSSIQVVILRVSTEP